MNLNAKIPAWIQAVGAVVVASAGFAYWCGHMNSDIGHLQKDVARIDERLDQMQISLLDLRAAEAPKKVLQEIANLQSKQFSKSLPAIQKITEQPVATIAPDRATLYDVAVKLSQVGQATPDYWSTVLSYIQWASAGMSPGSSIPPAGTRAMILGDTNAIIGSSLSGIAVVIDGAILQNNVFENCRVIFTGKPTRLQNVTFINCVFDLPVTDQPTTPLKRMTEQLLAAGIQHAVVSLL